MLGFGMQVMPSDDGTDGGLYAVPFNVTLHNINHLIWEVLQILTAQVYRQLQVDSLADFLASGKGLLDRLARAFNRLLKHLDGTIARCRERHVQERLLRGPFISDWTVVITVTTGLPVSGHSVAGEDE